MLFLAAFAALLCGDTGRAAEKYEALNFLTWDRDPTSTMAVSLLSNGPAATECEWREAGAARWEKTAAEVRDFPNLSGWRVSRADLLGLHPGAHYEFRWPACGAAGSFATAPSDLRAPITFIDGGDVYIDATLMDRMNSLAASYDPLFIVWGGDLAYAGSDPALAERWVRFLRSVSERLVSKEGRLIPILVATGNHDSGRPYLKEGDPYRPPSDAAERRAAAPYLAALFPRVVDQAYRAIDFGQYLSLLLLDSRHLNNIEGAQTEWLAHALEDRHGVPNVFPVYHVPAFPSAKLESTMVPELIRKHWVPLFDLADIKVAFEHDSHTFKVTHPIREGKVASEGTVYFGDGAWGVPPREVEKARALWYIDKAAQTNNAHVVTLTPDNRTIRSVGMDGTQLNMVRQQIKVHASTRRGNSN